MDLAIVLSGNMGLDFTMFSDGGAHYLKQAIPLYPHISGSVSPHNALLPFLFHLTITYLDVIVAPTAGGHTAGRSQALHGNKMISSCLNPAYVAWRRLVYECLSQPTLPCVAESGVLCI